MPRTQDVTVGSVETASTVRAQAASPAAAPTGGTRAARVAAVAAPVALATAVGLHPADTADAAASLARIAGEDRIRWTVVHLLEPAAWLALAAVFLAMWTVPAASGRFPLRLGATVAALGAASISWVVYAHGEAYLHMTAHGVDGVAMQPLYTRFQGEIPLAGPLTLGFQLGLLLVGVGLFRSRAVPPWAAAVFALMPAIMAGMAGAPAAVAGLGFIPLGVALAVTAPSLGRSGSAA